MNRRVVGGKKKKFARPVKAKAFYWIEVDVDPRGGYCVMTLATPSHSLLNKDVLKPFAARTKEVNGTTVRRGPLQDWPKEPPNAPSTLKYWWETACNLPVGKLKREHNTSNAVKIPLPIGDGERSHSLAGLFSVSPLVTFRRPAADWKAEREIRGVGSSCKR